MDNYEILSNLKKILSEEKIKQNEPMKNHTSFKIGGPADFFINVDNVEELQEILKLSKDKNIPFFIIGNGSNLLVSDNGVRGLVLKLNFQDIKFENNICIVDSGVKLMYLGQILAKNNLSGFEELSGIPGTIGGATFMNAGAYGKEIKDVLKEVLVMDYEGNIFTLKNKDCDFSYRHSIFEDKDYIILQVKLILENGNEKEIKEKMNEYLKSRKEKQPIEFSSAGSTFKRGEDFITAKLIDEAGLKGYRIGGAEISTKHAGFIINVGNATCKDVLDLADYTKRKVFEKFNKRIQLEIKQIRRLR